MSEKITPITQEAILHDLYVVIVVLGLAVGVPILAVELMAGKPDMMAGVVPIAVSATLALLYKLVFPSRGNKEEV